MEPGPAQIGLHGACKTAGCTIEPQWTLESPALEANGHVARVKTTDGLGRSAESSVNFAIARDTAKPTLEVSGELFNAPEGWVEQETYGLTATATDRGYGVTWIMFNIDGKAVALASKSCPNGACSETLSKQISMAHYAGGSHSAEIVATDGAGNTEVKHWTINVDPEGHVSTSELSDTLEALEQTTTGNFVGAAELEATEGTAADIGVEAGSAGIEASGSSVPLIINRNPSEGISLEILPSNAFDLPCYSHEEKELTESSGATCLPPADTSYEEVQPIRVIPTAVATTASEAEIVDGNAATSANTAPNVDSVVRPLFDGALTFQDIRDASAPEEFSWEVKLEPGQYMHLVDSQHIQVYFASGHPAFAIAAQLAHDAVGTTVPTSLSTAGGVVTEKVAHRAGGYVYPIVDGIGWEGGFTSTYISVPKDEAELREERERLEREEKEALEREQREEVEASLQEIEIGGWRLKQAYEGAPVFEASTGEGGAPKRHRTYRFNECRFSGGSELPFGPDGRRIEPNGASQQCHGEYEEHNGTYSLDWAYAIHGLFHYKWNESVWITEVPSCTPPWGPKKPLQLNCQGPALGQKSTTHIDVIDKARWAPGDFGPGRPYVCGEIDGVMSTTPPPSTNGERVLHETMHFYREQRQATELPCGWDHLKEA